MNPDASHFDPADVRARYAKRHTQPRQAKPAPPFFWSTDKELRFIVERIPEGRGRAARAVALWIAFCALANRKRGPRFRALRSELSALSGLSKESIVDALQDLERIGMIERDGPPNTRGQVYALRTPAVPPVP